MICYNHGITLREHFAHIEGFNDAIRNIQRAQDETRAFRVQSQSPEPNVVQRIREWQEEPQPFRKELIGLGIVPEPMPFILPL